MANRKEQIVETAAELLQTRVFSAFSYQDIADRLGITKAAIHSHYRTKEMLGIALLEGTIGYLKEMHFNIEESTDSSWDRFNAYVENTANMVFEENKICPVCVLQAEHNVIPESMQKGVSHVYNYNREWMAKILKQGRDKGDMIFNGTPEDQALLVMATIQGAIMSARAENPETFRNTIEQLKNTMKPV
ncbi:MAG: TetR/AcrR family transcriptional regulator [Desulfobacterales bacterium]|nr:TetR/AcrR family transcriptional regulator [Desulfobacterales bacterium]MCP4158779.1 TetR/AcrR family transcriptional regulator [Deltaproteobacteria bacterium]